MKPPLKDRTSPVTGASSGIGHALVWMQATGWLEVVPDEDGNAQTKEYYDAYRAYRTNDLQGHRAPGHP